ncbi:MAG TPA: CHAP domain-containing protein, partial [Gemmatimonadales bacterium]|nr:CHAP domain-containing protein [Gemmatimonadales bacterium]
SDTCSGFVHWACLASGADLVEGNSAFMFGVAAHARAINRRGPPLPGDLVFFRETYDRNRDRKRDDGITHVGLVERVEPDGTVVFIHRAVSGVRESRMNLRHPSQRRDGDGNLINDFIRRGNGKRRAPLAGEQFAGYGNLDQLYRHKTRLAVAGRQPSLR